MKIEKNIPIPERHKTTMSSIPFEEMEIGDSVYILDSEMPKIKVRGYASYQNKHNSNKKKFTCRMDAKGMRVWRTQ